VPNQRDQLIAGLFASTYICYFSLKSNAPQRYSFLLHNFFFLFFFKDDDGAGVFQYAMNQITQLRQSVASLEKKLAESKAEALACSSEHAKGLLSLVELEKKLEKYERSENDYVVEIAQAVRARDDAIRNLGACQMELHVLTRHADIQNGVCEGQASRLAALERQIEINNAAYEAKIAILESEKAEADAKIAELKKKTKTVQQSAEFKQRARELEIEFSAARLRVMSYVQETERQAQTMLYMFERQGNTILSLAGEQAADESEASSSEGVVVCLPAEPVESKKAVSTPVESKKKAVSSPSKSSGSTKKRPFGESSDVVEVESSKKASTPPKVFSVVKDQKKQKQILDEIYANNDNSKKKEMLTSFAEEIHAAGLPIDGVTEKYAIPPAGWIATVVLPHDSVTSSLRSMLAANGVKVVPEVKTAELLKFSEKKYADRHIVVVENKEKAKCADIKKLLCSRRQMVAVLAGHLLMTTSDFVDAMASFNKEKGFYDIEDQTDLRSHFLEYLEGKNLADYWEEAPYPQMFIVAPEQKHNAEMFQLVGNLVLKDETPLWTVAQSGDFKAIVRTPEELVCAFLAELKSY
jgi:hypothetical protein